MTLTCGKRLNKRDCLVALVQGKKVYHKNQWSVKSFGYYIHIVKTGEIFGQNHELAYHSLLHWIQETQNNLIWYEYDSRTEEFIKGLRLV